MHDHDKLLFPAFFQPPLGPRSMSINKDAIVAAVNKYYDRQRDKENKLERSRKNKKPEKETEKAVFEWAKANDVYLHVVDSSAGFDQSLGRRQSYAAPTGFPDLVGNDQHGLCYYIELKARQRRASLRDHQRHFLYKKIYQNCFAVCVDSAERLDQYHRQYSKLKTPQEKVTYLVDCLPKKRPKQLKEDLF